MKRVALVTDDKAPDLGLSDRELVAPLQARNIETFAVSWQRAGVEWASFDAVILRACWNYHAHIEAYRDWLDDLERRSVNVWNRVRVARWNMDKGYLRDLEQRGVAVPPTVWLERGMNVDLAELMYLRGWRRVVIKPRIGASAYHIWDVTLYMAQAEQARMQELSDTREGGWLVQEFLPEIAEGEWSFVFIRAEFSHAVIKRPGGESIFVQPHRGGSSQRAVAPPELVAQAHRVLTAGAECLRMAPRDFLYARVDAIPRGERLWCIELEVMEPGLFLNYDSPRAAERFAEAIQQVAA